VRLSLRRLGHVGDADARPWYTAMVFSAALSLATAALVWLGYVATREWRRGTEELRERSAAEALVLTDAALSRDMKGAWASLIVPINQFSVDEDPPYDLRQQTAQAFAKFPYPESFVVWTNQAGQPRTYVFNRADRQPHWDDSHQSDDPFPVVMLDDPANFRVVIDEARRRADSRSPFILFDCDIEGVPYQVVAHLMFSSALPHTLTAVVAFTVNLTWVRAEYFGPLLDQVARIGGTSDALSLAITDEHGRAVAASGAPAASTGTDVQRRFPLLFLEPSVVTASSASRAGIREFSVHVRPSATGPVQATVQAAYRMLALIGVAAAATTIALLQTVRAVRQSARLASMKSEFVSAVTHELKTPLALIRLVAETLARGRYSSPEVIQEYARLLAQETSRLGQSIDNLLTYARYTDAANPPALPFAPVDAADLVEDAIERFRPALSEGDFTVTVDVARDLPRIAVDGSAITQVLEILIDNAIKYSRDTRALAITGHATNGHVAISVADRGAGIHEEDIARVFDRFYRGRNAKESGSGLGLAIARRILQHHGGDIAIRSTVGVGTEVELTLPAQDTT
jgi:signal transduction histidine kinase